MEEGIGVDQQCLVGVFQGVAQGHVLGAEVIAVRLAPGDQLLGRHFADLHRQAGVGTGVVGIDPDRQAMRRPVAEVGEGAGDAEQGFLVVGLSPVDQVDQMLA